MSLVIGHPSFVIRQAPEAGSQEREVRSQEPEVRSLRVSVSPRLPSSPPPLRPSAPPFRRSARRGLSSLELVLSLPLLLFVMALMVVSESKMCWKVRGDVTARDAAWRSRFGRSGANLPNPVNWQPPATMGAADTPPNPLLDLAELQQPVVRGPMFENFPVDTTKFDNTLGGRLGRSHRSWTPPLLPKLGAASLDSQHLIWDTKWQYWQMYVISRQTYIPANDYRRTLVLYQLPQPDPGLEQAYRAALAALQNSPLKPVLAVLDRDDEILFYTGGYHDFHPRVFFCDANRMRVAANQVRNLINQIQGGVPPRPSNGVPGNMGRFFRGMYQQRLNQIRAAGGDDPVLQQKIDQLDAFLSKLP